MDIVWTWRTGQWTVEHEGESFRVLVVVGQGTAFFAVPEWNWCAEWDPLLPPPGPEWVRDRSVAHPAEVIDGITAALDYAWRGGVPRVRRQEQR